MAPHSNDAPYCPLPSFKKLETFNDWFLRKWSKTATSESQSPELLMFKSLHEQCSKNSGIRLKFPYGRPILETKAVKTKFGNRTFSYTGPKLWNALPLDIREEDNIDNFKKKLKQLYLRMQRSF